MKTLTALSLGLTFALVGVSCSHSSAPTAASPTGGGTPTQAMTPVSQKLSYGYYDAHLDSFISTDVSVKSQVTVMNSHVNYSPALAGLNPKSYPLIYFIEGKAASGQITVFGSQPGETDYSPIWDEANVTWKSGATPVVLKSDNQINALAAKGKLTVQRTSTLLNCPIIAVGTKPSALSSGATVGKMVVSGYYDAHKDTYVNTDTSSKAESGMMHINYAPGLAAVQAKALPFIYMIQGKAAPNQITVFGSQPGETDYSPLWQDTIVKWKSGVTPVLLTSDNQINTLASKGELKLKHTSTVLNCPILSVGSSA